MNGLEERHRARAQRRLLAHPPPPGKSGEGVRSRSRSETHRRDESGRDIVCQRWLGHSQLMTTMNIYVTDLDDGLGGAEELDGLWGHPGATDHPQTATNGNGSNGETPLTHAVTADIREALD
jgi:hypothetical protein